MGGSNPQEAGHRITQRPTVGRKERKDSMNWNYDMSEAPKGEVRKISLTHGKGQREITVKVPVLISTGTEVISSFWSDVRGQWSGIGDNEEAVAWAAWPEPAKKETA
jgi:hypothetical protein